MKLNGRVWKFGDGLSVFDLLAAKYDSLGFNDKWDECASHLLEDIAPHFVQDMRPGDIIVGGEKLGGGHSHFHRATIMACRAAGVAAILGESVRTLFLRGSIDHGLVTWALPGITTLVADGDRLEVDLRAGTATNLSNGGTASFTPLAPLILEILDAGGAFNWAKRRAGATSERLV